MESNKLVQLIELRRWRNGNQELNWLNDLDQGIKVEIDDQSIDISSENEFVYSNKNSNEIFYIDELCIIYGANKKRKMEIEFWNEKFHYEINI